jgi:hypothetical protein
LLDPLAVHERNISYDVSCRERSGVGSKGGLVDEIPEVLDRRPETIERASDTIKQWMNKDVVRMRSVEKVRAEFSLTTVAYNLRRVLNLVGFAELMAAVAVWNAWEWVIAGPEGATCDRCARRGVQLQSTVFRRDGDIKAHRRLLVIRRLEIQRSQPKGEFSHGPLYFHRKTGCRFSETA